MHVSNIVFDLRFVQKSIAERKSRRKRAVGDVLTMDAVRIAVGKIVMKDKCSLSIQMGTKDPYILFTYWNTGKKSEHSVYLHHDELKEVKYSIAEEDGDIDDSMTVMAFRIAPTDKNGFNKLTRAYHQVDSDNPEHADKRYITVELRDTSEFQVSV